jgi:signal transduction histidine kinase
MSTPPQLTQPTANLIQRLVGKIMNSNVGSAIANFPPVAWSVRLIARNLVRDRIGKALPKRVVAQRVAQSDLQATLNGIVIDVVEALGYVGAIVATYEPGDALPVRAFYADPAVASREQILEWEALVANYSPDRPVSLSNPDIARVYVHHDEYQENLGAKASKSQQTQRSNDMFSLFTPIAPDASRPFLSGIQEALGVREVIAVPFFLETMLNGETTRELVGNLFALGRHAISQRDERVLEAFGRQAAAAILSERRRLQIQVAQTMTFEIQTSLRDEQHILQHIVEGVVSNLGYAGAIVATYEPSGALPVRAFYVNPAVASIEQVLEWEAQVALFTPDHPISISNPNIARVYVDQAEYQDNLGVKAFKSGKPERSKELFSLFTPIISEASRPAIAGIQEALGVQEVIAVPFFLEHAVDGQINTELVGNLFALSTSRQVSSGEIELLQAFGQQAAAGLRNARLYHEVAEQRRIAEAKRQEAEEQRQIAEDRRQASEIFGKMAFGAAASVHALKNHIGVVRASLQVLSLIESFPEEQRRELLGQLGELSKPIFSNLDQVADILDNLHEPWRQSRDVPTDVNECVLYALRKVMPDHAHRVHIALAEGIPAISISPDMLREAFKVIIKNAAEAIAEKDQQGDIWLASCLRDDSTIEVTIRDNGIGIKPENLSRIFEMRWTTKRTGLGFGLFWAKDYIEGLGGRVEVESVWQEGTIARICIPTHARLLAVGAASTSEI